MPAGQSLCAWAWSRYPVRLATFFPAALQVTALSASVASDGALLQIEVGRTCKGKKKVLGRLRHILCRLCPDTTSSSPNALTQRLTFVCCFELHPPSHCLSACAPLIVQGCTSNKYLGNNAYLLVNRTYVCPSLLCPFLLSLFVASAAASVPSAPSAISWRNGPSCAHLPCACAEATSVWESATWPIGGPPKY